MNIKKEDIFVGSEKNHVIDKVKLFQDFSTKIRKNLESLHELKKQQTAPDGEVKAKTSQNYAFLVQSRKNLRELYLEVEKNRIRSQLEKEKIDQLSNYLESIIYQKNNTEREILQCKNVQLPSLQKLEGYYQDVQSQKDKLEDTSVQNFQKKMMDSLCSELELRRKLKSEFAHKEGDRNSLISANEEKISFLSSIPQTVKKLADACKPLQTLFKVSSSLNYDQVQLSLLSPLELARELPDKLYNVYAKLVGVRNSNTDQRFDVQITDTDDTTDPNTTKMNFHSKQLSLVIDNDENDPLLEQYAKVTNDASMNFLKSIYPLNFRILLLKNYNTVIITLHRRSFFDTEEILSQLSQEESGTKIFYEPRDEDERNINNKYSVYNWMQSLAVPSKAQSVESQDLENRKTLGLIEKIRERVRNKLWLVLQYDLIKKAKKFTAPLAEVLNERLGHAKLDVLVDFNYEISSFKHATIDDFLNLQSLPSFIKKKHLNVATDETSLMQEKGIMEQLREIQEKKAEHQLISKYGVSLPVFFKKQTGVDLYDKNQNPKESFYKFEIHLSKYKIYGVVKLDHDYPQKPPMFKLRFGKTEKTKPVIPETIAKRFAHAKNADSSNKNTTERAPAFNNEIKEKVEDFINQVEPGIKHSHLVLSWQLIKLLIAINKVSSMDDELLSSHNLQKLTFKAPL